MSTVEERVEAALALRPALEIARRPGQASSLTEFRFPGATVTDGAKIGQISPTPAANVLVEITDGKDTWELKLNKKELWRAACAVVDRATREEP